MRRGRGTGALIPPKAGISRYWRIQFYADGRAVRESTHSTSKVVAEAMLERRLREVALAKIHRLRDSAHGQRLEFSGPELKIFLQPCVYVFYLRDQVLYVGIGKDITRPFAREHHQRTNLKDADKVYIYPCLDVAEALQKENELIVFLQPLLNRVTNLSRKAEVAEQAQ